MIFSFFSLLFWSFLAATILPVGVEPYFLYHVSTYEQPVLSCVIASIGNIAGSTTILWLGITGSNKISTSLNDTNKKIWNAASTYFNKYGTGTLFFSWVPFIGDIFVLMASLSKPNILRALMYISIGKTARFVFLAWTVSI